MASTIVIIDYGSGNLRSAAKSFAKIIDDHSLPFDVKISAEPKDLQHASHIILPGQGAFADCMNGLSQNPHTIPLLNEAVWGHKIPFLGICVGMQLLMTTGYEHGTYQGLGWIEGDVVPLTPSDPHLKIPHMGWNDVVDIKPTHPALQHIQSGTNFYFVHSFVVQCKDTQHALAHFDYGGKHTAIVGRDHVLGVQFHPEKSQQAGLDLLHHFLTKTY
jgi:imidazole glycerol-phosphate synthase subunit HisH